MRDKYESAPQGQPYWGKLCPQRREKDYGEIHPLAKHEVFAADASFYSQQPSVFARQTTGAPPAGDTCHTPEQVPATHTSNISSRDRCPWSLFTDGLDG
ncbi:Hypp9494 [Branchiostoma lanceolatum]|uniref:Hypp9494 protein n=1 Tax=Branchiostoma lanceolatum TaxID=7740 RepID=A0A8S4MMP6_BRALA|nr:Hypp9494 [Branchiostoma lanceolatum]